MSILDKKAYKAMQALKDQALAVSANNYKGDSIALKDAQLRMSSNQPWTSKIAKALLESKSEDDTVETITNEWLEKKFG